MQVIFFNHWHNGDLHVVRGFLRQIMNKLRQLYPNISFIMTHKQQPNTLSDIPDLQYNDRILNRIGDQKSVVKEGDILYINTWYGQEAMSYVNSYGITIDCLYAIFDHICQNAWGFNLNQISQNLTDFYPVIDYSKFDINPAQGWLTSYSGNKILIENGPVLSEQAHNFDIASIITEIARRHPDKIFILTHKDKKIHMSNIFYSHDIIRKNGVADLNEISFLSTYCDVIIGKASGVFSFCLTHQNLFQRKTKFLCFTTTLMPIKHNQFWLGRTWQDRVNYSCSFTVSNTNDINEISRIIESAL